MDEKLILRKIEKVREYVGEIRRLAHFRDFHEFVLDVKGKRFVERNLQLAIDFLLDVCKYMVSSLLDRVPDSYSECIDLLAEAGYIPREHAELWKRMVRYRNLIVCSHEVDDAVTYDIHRKHLGDFEVLIGDVLAVLERYQSRQEEERPAADPEQNRPQRP